MLKIGDLIYLEPTINPNGEKYRCRVVEKMENRIYIDYPVNNSTGKTVFLLNGTQLKAFIAADSTSAYFFDTTVLGRVKQNIAMIVLSYPGEDSMYKIQRREYVRVETSVDVAVHSLNGEFQPFVSITRDISAGGAAIILPSSKTIIPGLDILTHFVLPSLSEEYHYVTLRSNVIRIVDGKNGERNRASIKFVDISESDRQLLIKFCFERQLLLKKKGIHSSEIMK
ncbi:flagellar brake domain-containing protein [Fredinandcohnia sp. QZ13]|uniref:flagellar brake protein n=1 Tax=Fredinandcohnia sp. QZ13 TaxID=3073144 RepID=UPI00285344D4|nr:flagellar brake domain-containing protein [Fredinandcohnia sp. QZ13]MDR4888739.1 flagellar brake domain-containing protein [Fredinandcohnia sp. QZ13]